MSSFVENVAVSYRRPPRRGAHAPADAAVTAAERGLVAWREAKVAWLESFALFTAQEEASDLVADTRIPPRDRGAVR